jgi:FlaA1/EpsC-like NDP-sugar epimerase
MLLQRTTWLLALFQALLVLCSLVLAWLLRFDFSLPYRSLLFSVAPVLILIRLAAIAPFGLYHGWWRFAGVSDVLDILKAVALGSAAFFLTTWFLLGARTFPRSIYVLEALITVGLLSGVRLFARAVRETLRTDLNPCQRVVVIGAGFAGQMILREIAHRGSGYQAVACVDDDPSKLGLKIQGVPVLGSVDQLPAILRKHPADEIFIAVPSATGTQMQQCVSSCEKAGVKFRTVPALRDLIAGQATVSQLREVNLDDLLGRDPVEMDLERVRRQIAGRTVMVTGAAGSIGSELSRQILAYGPAKLLCLDQSETGIFYQQLELSKHENGSHLVCCVADVGDRERLRSILVQHRPEVIFHAAAYKHVPVMESNVHEAVKNNVLALLQLLEVAEEGGCQSFVLISSDKAVNPTNVMGATKRVGELMVSCRPARGMRCVSVRFGNVLGSNGSVVPVLQEQLRSGQQLTITHPDVRRFFMTTREAVALVLQAFAIGNHGDTLVLDIGEPLRILDLARSLIRLSGKSPSQVEILFTGLRPGEKMCEELFYATEAVLPTSCQRIRKARSQLVSWSHLERQFQELRACLSLDGAAPVRACLKQIVPEYVYSESSAAETTCPAVRVSAATM